MSDYRIDIFHSEEDNGYIAEIPDLDSCYAFGRSPQEELREVLQARDAWLAAARQLRKPVPRPSPHPPLHSRGFSVPLRLRESSLQGRHSMARKCDICGKGTVTGNKVSHAKNRTRRVWKPNLHEVRTMVGKTKTSLKVCTRCLRSGKVEKVL